MNDSGPASAAVAAGPVAGSGATDPGRAGRPARRWILAAAILGSGIVFLDGTVVNVALARIGHDLPHGALGVLEGQTYVYNGYLLAMCALLVPAGAIGDRFGRRRIFLFGLAGFGAASLLCGLAPSMEALIAFRVLQGAAGALLVPGSMALLRVHFEGAEQGRAFGLWAAGTSVTALAGPFVGGLLVDSLGWRSVFILNVPLVLVAMYATSRHVPETSDPAGGRLDLVGALLFALAAGGVSFGIIDLQAHQWRSPVGWTWLLIGLASTAALPWWMLRARNPLVPPALFRIRTFTVINLATFSIYGALYVYGYYQSLFLQSIAGWSAAAAGLVSVPASVILILISPRAGRLAATFGARPFMVAGPALMGAAALLMARIPQSPFYPLDVLPASILFGLGVGLMVTPLTTALMGSVPARNAGVSSAFNNAVSRVGPQIGGALVFAAVSAVFFAQLGAMPEGVYPMNRPLDPAWVQPAAAASTTSFHVAMLICAGLLAAGALVSLVGLAAGPPARAPD